MTFNETLEKYKAEDPQSILDALEELNQDCLTAASVANEAEKAYYASASGKQKKIDSRIAELVKQCDGYQAKIEALKEPLVVATVAGDANKLSDIKADMKKLEVDKSQVSTEINMLKSTHVSGDAELYNDVISKNDSYLVLREAYLEAKRKVFEFAIKRVEAYEKIKKGTMNHRIGGGYGPKIDELNKHFHFEEYAKNEAEAVRQAATLEAERANKPISLKTNSYVFGGEV